MHNQTTTAYREHGIEKRFDSQSGYGTRESYYGNGKYPPDWDSRREAVWDRQRYQCGRCGVYKGDTAVNEVHHIVHLAQGGSNALENLVGLCGDCHALMHPTITDLRGSVDQANLFPDERADDRVAVIRKPRRNDDLAFDLERLSQLSSPDANANAMTSRAVPTSAKIARCAETSLHRFLLDNDFVPRTSAYHRVGVRPQSSGILGAISSRGVDLTARGDGDALEVEADDDRIDVYYSIDTTVTNLELQDPAGEVLTEQIRLQDEESRFRVEKPISVPPLTAATAPEYAIDALTYFGWHSVKIGAIPGLLLAFLVPSAVPASGSLVGLVGIVLLIGFLLRSPLMYREISSEPTETVVDERTEPN